MASAAQTLFSSLHGDEKFRVQDGSFNLVLKYFPYVKAKYTKFSKKPEDGEELMAWWRKVQQYETDMANLILSGIAEQTAEQARNEMKDLKIESLCWNAVSSSVVYNSFGNRETFDAKEPFAQFYKKYAEDKYVPKDLSEMKELAKTVDGLIEESDKWCEEVVDTCNRWHGGEHETDKTDLHLKYLGHAHFCYLVDRESLTRFVFKLAKELFSEFREMPIKKNKRGEDKHGTAGMYKEAGTLFWAEFLLERREKHREALERLLEPASYKDNGYATYGGGRAQSFSFEYRKKPLEIFTKLLEMEKNDIAGLKNNVKIQKQKVKGIKSQFKTFILDNIASLQNKDGRLSEALFEFMKKEYLNFLNPELKDYKLLPAVIASVKQEKYLRALNLLSQTSGENTKTFAQLVKRIIELREGFEFSKKKGVSLSFEFKFQSALQRLPTDVKAALAPVMSEKQPSPWVAVKVLTEKYIAKEKTAVRLENLSRKRLHLAKGKLELPKSRDDVYTGMFYNAVLQDWEATAYATGIILRQMYGIFLSIPANIARGVSLKDVLPKKSEVDARLEQFERLVNNWSKRRVSVWKEISAIYNKEWVSPRAEAIGDFYSVFLNKIKERMLEDMEILKAGIEEYWDTHGVGRFISGSGGKSGKSERVGSGGRPEISSRIAGLLTGKGKK